MLTTTLNKIKSFSPCQSGWEKLLKSLNKTQADDNSLNLLSILESNGVEDTLWAFRAATEPSHDVLQLICIEFAESVLHIYEKYYPSDLRPRKALQAKRDFISGKITAEELSTAEAAAWDAVWAAARAVGAAARAAGAAGAAGDAAWDAARAVAWAVARDAAARDAVGDAAGTVAWAAAGAVAGAVAGDAAARDAVGDAAARDAVGDAAGTVAWAAAGAVAGAVAGDAAGAVARDAAGTVARDAEREKQKQILIKYLSL